MSKLLRTVYQESLAIGRIVHYPQSGVVVGYFSSRAGSLLPKNNHFPSAGHEPSKAVIVA